MNYIYGQLNQKIYKVEYNGIETDTAYVDVDNRYSTIGVDVKCVPYSLLVKNSDGTTKCEFNGSSEAQFILSDYIIERLNPHRDGKNIYEYVLKKDGVKVGDTIEIPKPITGASLTEEGGHHFLVFDLGDGHSVEVNVDDIFIEYVSGDNYINITDGDNSQKVISLNMGALKEELGIDAINQSIQTLESDVEALGGSIPTKTSDLANDSGFITNADIPTRVSQLQNDSGFITNADIPSVDQTFAPTSELAQSGKAVSEAISTKQDNLSEAQLKAVNSGITQDKVNLYDTFNARFILDEQEIATKQDELSAGANIDITNNVISAKDTTYTAGTNVTISEDNVISAVDTTYEAGENVSIDNGVISAVDTQYSAGSGLSLSGTQFSVDTTTIATKSDLDAKQDALTEEQLDVINSGISIEKVAEIESDIADLDLNKQNKLVAGEGIDITNNVISATHAGETYTAGNGLNLSQDNEFSIDTSVVATQDDLEGKQDTLQAGEGITIENNVISASVGTLDYDVLQNIPITNIEEGDEVVDGSYYRLDGNIYKCIDGELSEIATQDDLDAKQDTLTFDSAPMQGSTNPVTSGGVFTALSGKQGTLTQGDNIQISGDTISAVDTTYSQGDGILINEDNEISIDEAVVATKDDVASVESALDAKQDILNIPQTEAINSGINSEKVEDFEAHINDEVRHVTQADKDLWNQNHLVPEGEIDVEFNGDAPTSMETIPLNNIVVGNKNYKVSSAASEGGAFGDGLPRFDSSFLTPAAIKAATPNTIYKYVKHDSLKFDVTENDTLTYLDVNTLSTVVFDDIAFKDVTIGNNTVKLAPLIRFVSDDMEWRPVDYATTEPVNPSNNALWMDNSTILRQYKEDIQAWVTKDYVTQQPSSITDGLFWLNENKLYLGIKKIRNIFSVDGEILDIYGHGSEKYHIAKAHGSSSNVVSEGLNIMPYIMNGSLQRYNGSTWVDVPFTNGATTPENPSEGDYWISLEFSSLPSNFVKQQYVIKQFTSGEWIDVKTYTPTGSAVAEVPYYLVNKETNPTTDSFFYDLSGNVSLEGYFNEAWVSLPLTTTEGSTEDIPYFDQSTNKLYMRLIHHALWFTDNDYIETNYVAPSGSEKAMIYIYLDPINFAQIIGGWALKKLDLNIIGTLVANFVDSTSIDEDYSTYKVEEIYQNKFVGNVFYRTYIAESQKDLFIVRDPSKFFDDNGMGILQNAMPVMYSIAGTYNTLSAGGAIPIDSSTFYISSNEWVAGDSSIDPYTFYCKKQLHIDSSMLSMFHTTKSFEDKRLELVNDYAVLFARYGFAVLEANNFYEYPTYTSIPASPQEDDFVYGTIDNVEGLFRYQSGEWVRVSGYQNGKPDHYQASGIWLEDLGDNNYQVYVWESEKDPYVTIGVTSEQAPASDSIALRYKVFDSRAYMFEYAKNGILSFYEGEF